MTLPCASLSAYDGSLGVSCPYCGLFIQASAVRLHPVADPGDGRIDTRNVPWESRCPRCGGDFSVRGRDESRCEVRHIFTGTDPRLAQVMASLESLEAAVAGLTSITEQPGRPPSDGFRRRPGL